MTNTKPEQDKYHSLRGRLTGIILLACASAAMLSAQPYEIWVAPGGSDNAPGTPGQPMATLLMAQRKARELQRLDDPGIGEGISIIMRGGVYPLQEPLFFRPEDSGTAGGPTIIEAAEGEIPVISGGVEITGWKKPEGTVDRLPAGAAGKVWAAPLPEVGGRTLEFRQLWVNNRKAVRAGTLDDEPLDRILGVDREQEVLWIPRPQTSVSELPGLEFVIHQWWAIAILRVKSIEPAGDSAAVSFHQPESRIEFEHPWPPPFIDEGKNLNGNSAFWFVNAIGFLDHPGEWYADSRSRKIYYWPREGEDMAGARVIAPVLETLLSVEGTLDDPVTNLRFEGITFEYTSWMRPSMAGHVPLQAGMFLLDAYKLKVPGTPDKASLENQAWTGRQPAGVTVRNARDIHFERCRIRHMAATGLDLVSGTSNTAVSGCIISDIGGTGIQAGYFGGPGIEAHLPYDPEDNREVCHHLILSNNLVTDCTNEDWGCVGISVGYAYDIDIEHNEVSYLNYSGICIGWGWTRTVSCMRNNRIHANLIHHFARNMYDVGGIYTLSAQPYTEITGNSIRQLEKAPYAHIPEHYQYIYLDEGSSYIRVADNWTEKDKFFSNQPGPGIEWENNGPGVSGEIRQNAGLQPAYRDLLQEYENSK